MAIKKEKEKESKIITPFERKRQIIFLHTPKSAGWSLSEYITRKLFEKGEESYLLHDHVTFEKSRKIEIEKGKNAAFVHGHFSWNTSEKLHQPHSNTFMFTTLRQPQDRVISLFFFLRNLPKIASSLPGANLKDSYDEIKKMSPLEFLESTDKRINYQINNYLTRQFAGDLDDVPIFSTREGVQRKRNEMLWVDGVEKSEIAMRHLLQLDDIAFIDSYEKDFRRIVRKLGFSEQMQMVPNSNKTKLVGNDERDYYKLVGEFTELLQGDFRHLIQHDTRLYRQIQQHQATLNEVFNFDRYKYPPRVVTPMELKPAKNRSKIFSPRKVKQRVTLMIPTYNRSIYLAKQLNYLSRNFSPDFYRIDILDGSTDMAEKNKNKHLADTFNVHYKWYNSDTVSGYERIISGIKRSNTDYIQFMPDDDYFNESTMRKHVSLLDEDDSLVGAYGHSLSFNLRRRADGVPDTWIFLDHYRHNISNESMEEPLKRLFYAIFDRNRNSYFALYRRNVLLDLHESVKEAAVLNTTDKKGNIVADTEFFYFGDFSMTLFSLMAGKKMNSHLPMMAYEVGNVQAGIVRKVQHELAMDPNFQFVKRSKMLVDKLVQVFERTYKSKKDKRKLLEKYFENLLLTWISSVGVFCNSSISNLNETLTQLGQPYAQLIKVPPATFTHDKFVFDDKEEFKCRNCEARGDDVCVKTYSDYKFILEEMKSMSNVPIRITEVGYPEFELMQTLFNDRPREFYADPNAGNIG